MLNWIFAKQTDNSKATEQVKSIRHRFFQRATEIKYHCIIKEILFIP